MNKFLCNLVEAVIVQQSAEKSPAPQHIEGWIQHTAGRSAPLSSVSSAGAIKAQVRITRRIC